MVYKRTDIINGKPRYTSLKRTGKLGGSVGGLKSGTKLIHVQDHYRGQALYIPMREYNRSQKAFRAKKYGVRAVYSSQSVRNADKEPSGRKRQSSRSRSSSRR